MPKIVGLTKLWMNITTCGGYFQPTSKNYRRAYLTNIMLLVAMSVFAPFSLINAFLLNDPTLAKLELIAFILILAIFIYFRFNRNVERVSFFATLVLGFIILSLLYYIKHYEYAIFWIATYPPFGYFINGLKRGTLAAFLLFVPVFAMLVINLNVWEPAPFVIVSIYNITAAYAVLVVLIYFTEKSRNEAQKQLHLIKDREATEKERNRLLREMHDGLGAQLTSALYASRNNQTTTEELSNFLELALDDLRIMMDSMQAFDGDIATLLGQLRYRLERRIQQVGIELEWKVDDLPDFPNMSPQDALNLQRVVQECLVNTIKHAKASKVSLVATMLKPNCLKILVRDNGCGFDDENNECLGRGLSNLYFRAKEMGARLTINTQPNRGSSVELLIPVSKTSNS